MIFRNCAQIAKMEIDAIGDRIEKECSDDRLQAFLATWNPWIKHQKESQIPSYESLPIDKKTKPDEDSICPISQYTPEQPVSYIGTIYDYDSFIGYFKAVG